MKLFGNKNDEVEIDEMEVSLLIETFQTYINNIIAEKQIALLNVDKETEDLIQKQNDKKQQISNNFFNKINKYQALITKIQKGDKQ